jgi:threonine/homoserine/homoserine lactone efflux protein
MNGSRLLKWQAVSSWIATDKKSQAVLRRMEHLTNHFLKMTLLLRGRLMHLMNPNTII